jgi:hypothetical protein
MSADVLGLIVRSLGARFDQGLADAHTQFQSSLGLAGKLSEVVLPAGAGGQNIKDVGEQVLRSIPKLPTPFSPWCVILTASEGPEATQGALRQAGTVCAGMLQPDMVHTRPAIPRIWFGLDEFGLWRPSVVPQQAISPLIEVAVMAGGMLTKTEIETRLTQAGFAFDPDKFPRTLNDTLTALTITGRITLDDAGYYTIAGECKTD